VICARYSEEFSHHQATRSLENWLADSGIAALTGIDTRALTRHLRAHGTLLGRIQIEGAEPAAWVDPNRRNLVREVSRRRPETFGRGRREIGLLDCGTKNQIIRDLLRHNVRVTAFPWETDAADLRDVAGVVLSNGPGNPRMARRSINTVRRLLRRDVPILGICLGHQLLALAAGASTFKLKFGHRSHNQPCVDTMTGRCYVTSQNHGFAVDPGRLPRGWREWFRNANDGTNEGIRHRRRPIRSVQFHPEATPGPGGTEWILEEFFADLD
jgi:carbamoyl-phosphate synthase small subunit